MSGKGESFQSHYWRTGNPPWVQEEVQIEWTLLPDGSWERNGVTYYGAPYQSMTPEELKEQQVTFQVATETVRQRRKR